MATVLSYMGDQCLIRKRCLSFQGRDVYFRLQDLTYTVLERLSQQSEQS
jgi:hypothetical protein